jgi:hypothetical protein
LTKGKERAIHLRSDKLGDLSPVSTTARMSWLGCGLTMGGSALVMAAVADLNVLIDQPAGGRLGPV